MIIYCGDLDIQMVVGTILELKKKLIWVNMKCKFFAIFRDFSRLFNRYKGSKQFEAEKLDQVSSLKS